MPTLTRRNWLRGCAASGAAALAADAPPARAADGPAKITFGFSLYGMKALSPAAALEACGKIGYDCVEFSLMHGWPTEPARLSSGDRKDLRGRLADAKLSLAALMENLKEPTTDVAHRSNLDRLKAAAGLAHDLSPDTAPVIETILGGKSGEWDKVKDSMARRLAAWAAVGKDAKAVIAVKPHVNNALHSPEQALWLLRQVESPWLKLAFDHSHFLVQGRKLADTAAALLPHAAFVHLKDARGTASKFEFLLPGTEGIDYGEYARLLRQAKYGGAVVVEVSAQVFNKPGYDPLAAARQCHAKLAPFFAG